MKAIIRFIEYHFSGSSIKESWEIAKAGSVSMNTRTSYDWDRYGKLKGLVKKVNFTKIHKF